MKSSTDKPKEGILKVIIAFKLVTVLLLVVVAFGAHHFMYRDVGDFVEHLVDLFCADPNNKYVEELLDKSQLVGQAQLKAVGFGSLFYAVIELTEAVGLAMRKRWAEYFVVVVTASFLPLEVIELYEKVSPIKIVMMLINILILVYLCVRLKRTGKNGAT